MSMRQIPAYRAPASSDYLSWTPLAIHTYRTDSDLIDGSLERDESAWKELVNRYSRLVYAIPRRFGLSPADADLVFQNVFALLLRRLYQLRDRNSLISWFISTTYRESQRISRAPFTLAGGDGGIPDAGGPPFHQMQSWEQEQRVHEALGQMDPRCRSLLVTLFGEVKQENFREIAMQLGVTEHSIGLTRSRCFKKLLAIMDTLGMDLP